MTDVHWLFQDSDSDRYETDIAAGIVMALGATAHRVRLKGFSPKIPEIPGLPDDAVVVCRGASWVPRALTRPWSPGIWFDPSAFCWSAFRDGWGDLMLSRDGRTTTLGQAKRELAAGARLFIRPNGDLKEFEGGVHDAASLDRALAEPWVRALDETLVVLATPVPVHGEWRTFVVDGEIVAASEYRREGQPSTEGFVPHRALDVVHDAISRWTPAPVFCLDVALEGERFGVVEANCFNAARFYAADGARILEAVTNFAAGDQTPRPPRP